MVRTRKLPFDRRRSERLNLIRLQHLGKLDLPLDGKRVLEVGAGVGKLTWFFEKRDCEVVSIDGRQSNCDVNLLRHPGRDVHCIDLEKPQACAYLGMFDIVFCYGLLYHTRVPAQVLADLSAQCSELFLLSTRVSRVDDGKYHLVEEILMADQGLHGTGCRPARDFVMNELSKHYAHVYVAVPPAHADYPTKWPTKVRNPRAVFVAARFKLESPMLSEVLDE